MNYCGGVRHLCTAILAAGCLYGAGVAGWSGQPASRVQPRPIKVLLVGDDREPHSSAALYAVLAPALARRGIQVTRVMTAQAALDAARLANYDAVLFYGDPVFTDPFAGGRSGGVCRRRQGSLSRCTPLPRSRRSSAVGCRCRAAASSAAVRCSASIPS